MLRSLIFLALITLASHQIATHEGPLFVVWNVGQGSWNTLVLMKECLHFDMGGERAPWKEIENLCSRKQNKIYLSHMDKDHVVFLKPFFRKFTSACLQNIPFVIPRRYQYFIHKVKKCSKGSHPLVKILWKPQKKSSQPLKKPKQNALSWIFDIYHGRILFPGDSTSKQEKLWGHQARKASYFILGHHGSLTSNSEYLMTQLRSCTLAIVSARKKVYGHPHKKVVSRLQKHKLPLLETEKWGHIKIQL